MQEIYRPELITKVERGVPISLLEKRMKTPFFGDRDYRLEVEAHGGWENFSEVTFLGDNERLLDVIETDWRTVELAGTTHAAIAQALKDLIRGKNNLSSGYEYVSKKKQHQALGAIDWGTGGVLGGWQECPWFCETQTEDFGAEGRFTGDQGTIMKKEITADEKLEASVAQFKFLEYIPPDHIADLLQSGEQRSIETARQIQRIQENMTRRTTPIYAFVTGLLPHLVAEHYFFEGKGSPYRAEPAFLIEAFGLGEALSP